MFHLATYFDKNYLSRGLVLYDSLKEHCKQFELYVLCLDEFTLNYFQTNSENFQEIKAISLSEIENFDKELKACKQNRSTIEYYFTLSPCMPLFLLKKYSLPHICTLDADILFLADPMQLFEYLNEYSVVITPHKFSPELKTREKFGVYNVSFQVFKNDGVGIACLNKWREQCIEWCDDHFEEAGNRFADQKYLDKWPELYKSNLKVLDDHASGIAPWNLNNYKITSENGHFYSDNEKIIFYHFHHYKFLNSLWATQGFDSYFVKKQKGINQLYLSYWKKVNKYASKLALTQNISTRHSNSSSLFGKLINEKSAYLKLSSTIIILLNFERLPSLFKKILRKLYA